MQTLKIDILQSKAIKLLEQLEQLNLIKMHKEKNQVPRIDWRNKYKGAMKKEPLKDVENQLNELRNGWE